ncbi:MAG: MBL fold metallo-hydrolase [Microscillaceae bacterium]|nr:MBL fold metallo-hydrolase [Microscillaceae bacterium]
MPNPIRLELPTNFMATVNAYLFLEPEPTLVDCGEKSEAVWKALVEQLHQYHLKIEDLRKIIITHAHVDHIGMAAQLVAHSPAEVWVSDYVYPWAIDFKQQWQSRMAFVEESWRLGNTPPELLHQVMAGMHYMPRFWEPLPAERVRRFDPQGIIEIGAQPWQSVYTPGHAITQTCFYQPESRKLLSADMLMYITPVAVIEQELNSFQRANSLPVMLESYHKVREMEISCVYPGHGQPFADHISLIDRQVERIHQRKEECLEWIKKGQVHLYPLSELMYKEVSLPLKFAGYAMTRGYVDLLLQEGRVAEDLQDGVWTFRLTA